MLARGKTTIMWIIAGVVVALACAFSWGVFVVSRSLEAEDNLQAVVTVTEAIDNFVLVKERWPKSWDELEQIPVFDRPKRYSWPNNSKWIRNRVKVDFRVTLQELIDDAAILHQAIEPLGPCYCVYDDYFSHLRQTIELVDLHSVPIR